MELINVIEISPYDYADEEYEFPAGSSVEFPDEWNAYWLKCISDKNLGHLQAIRKGSYLVDIETIHEHALEEIIKNHLKEVEPDDFEDQTGRLSGGIVVKMDDRFLIEPTCCGDIGNIKEWENMLENGSPDWTQLWIGHPWVFYKKFNQMIEFSAYTESELKDFKDMTAVIELPETDLRMKLNQLRKQQNDFESRIRNMLNQMETPHAERIAKLMTGND